MEADDDKGIVGLKDVGGVADRKRVSEGRCVTVVGGWVWLVDVRRWADSRNRNTCS